MNEKAKALLKTTHRCVEVLWRVHEKASTPWSELKSVECKIMRSRGVAVITLDFESSDPSSNLGGTYDQNVVFSLLACSSWKVLSYLIVFCSLQFSVLDNSMYFGKICASLKFVQCHDMYDMKLYSVSKFSRVCVWTALRSEWTN
jgi:hypothetical protein